MFVWNQPLSQTFTVMIKAIEKKNDLNELEQFLNDQKVQDHISEFCTTQHIELKFIPEKAPHFRGLWESAVKSMKYHLKRVTANVKRTCSPSPSESMLKQLTTCTFTMRW